MSSIYTQPLTQLFTPLWLVERSSTEKILGLLGDNPSLSGREIAEKIGISDRAVEKQISSLKSQGRLKRIGGAKGGHWGVVE